jgi:hypothetical protein
LDGREVSGGRYAFLKNFQIGTFFKFNFLTFFKKNSRTHKATGGPALTSGEGPNGRAFPRSIAGKHQSFFFKIRIEGTTGVEAF